MTGNRVDGLTRRASAAVNRRNSLLTLAAAALAAFAIPRGTDARPRNQKGRRCGDRDDCGEALAPCEPFRGLCNAAVVGYCNQLPNNQNECLAQCQHCCSVPFDICPAVSDFTCLLQCAPNS